MSMPDTFKNLLAQAFTDNVTHMSLHTADPGTTGANDSGITHAGVSWTGPTGGVSTGTSQFNAVSGNYPYVGLWEGATFRQGIECEIIYTGAANITVQLLYEVGEE